MRNHHRVLVEVVSNGAIFGLLYAWEMHGIQGAGYLLGAMFTALAAVFTVGFFCLLFLRTPLPGTKVNATSPFGLFLSLLFLSALAWTGHFYVFAMAALTMFFATIFNRRD